MQTVCHVFAQLISIPHFKSINFYQNRPKIKLFKIKQQNFELWGLHLLTPKTALPLQISGYAPKSNQVFALLIYMSLEFFVMPHLRSIHFYQNKYNLSYF